MNVLQMHGGKFGCSPLTVSLSSSGCCFAPMPPGLWGGWCGGEIPAKALKFDSRSSIIRNKYCIFTTWQCFVGSDGHEWKNKGVLALHRSVLMFSYPGDHQKVRHVPQGVTAQALGHNSVSSTNLRRKNHSQLFFSTQDRLQDPFAPKPTPDRASNQHSRPELGHEGFKQRKLGPGHEVYARI